MAKPAQSEDQPLHTHRKTIPSQSYEEAKATRVNPKQKMSIAQAHKASQSFSWPYHGQNNSAATQTRVHQQHNPTMNDGNNQQPTMDNEKPSQHSHGRLKCRPQQKTAQHEYTVTQNAIGHHSQQKHREENNPKT